MSAFDPVRIIEALVEAEVDFILIGQAAAFLQGNPVATVDLDIMPRRDLDNADRLAGALNSLHARRWDGHETELEGADFLGWSSQSFTTDAGPMDVVPFAAGIGGFEQVAVVNLNVGTAVVQVLTLDEIITSKQTLDRPKDRAALPALRATRAERRRQQGGSAPDT